jgi:plastocyanin
MMEQVPQPTRRRWWVLAAGLAALMLVTATACGGDDDDDDESSTDATEAEGGDATLEVTEFEFSDATAPAGGTLEVVNSSGAGHTVTADDGAFDAELGTDETITIDVPAEPGDYPYHCEIHPSMTATLTAE